LLKNDDAKQIFMKFDISTLNGTAYTPHYKPMSGSPATFNPKVHHPVLIHQRKVVQESNRRNKNPRFAVKTCEIMASFLSSRLHINRVS
jgi:hypothetical protein